MITYISHMADVIPFPAVRPTRDKVHLVASRAFYTYPKHVLEAKLDSNVYSFIHIINPEFREIVKTAPNSVERFEKVKQKYNEFREHKYLVKDDMPAYYMYKQDGSNCYCGIIAATSIDDYKNSVIKKHEETLTKRENIFKRYLDICAFNAEPVLMTYPDNSDIKDVLDKYAEQRPEFEFSTTDLVCHSLWPIMDSNDIATIKNAFGSMNALYIADGHHRSASSSLLGSERKNEGSDTPYDQYFMSYLIPESNLKILDFNRLVKDLNGLTVVDFLDKLSVKFNISPQSEPFKANAYNTFGLYTEGKWYALTLKESITEGNPVDALDPKILSDYILEPILAINDLKTSDRIHFEGGPKGFDKMIKLVDNGKYKVAFSLFPVSVEQLKTVADNNLTMPPKSTWIEPKLRSGLTIYEF